MTSKDSAPINRTSCVIGTAGHIDHGKTALVKALTGMDTDRLSEEKRRGVSIDLGFAHIDLDDGKGGVVRAALVDVPGHERFIRNMLAGTTGMDLVLFAVAADDGVMPQTREHLDIIRLLGIKRAVFVITKADLAGAERVEDVIKEVSALIENTVLAESPFVAFSAVTEEGLDVLKGLIRESVQSAQRVDDKDGFFRLPVDRSFVVKGFGTVVTGTVAGGEISKGGEAVCFPTGAAVKVRGIQSMYLDAGAVRAGQRAALNISGVNYRDITRGFVLASPELSVFAKTRAGTRVVDCLFEFTSSFAGGRKARNRPFKVHHLTDETLAAVQLAGSDEASPGAMVWGRLLLRKPLLMLRGDRFILRDPSINSTVGGGTVFVPYLSREAAAGITKSAFPSQHGTGAAEALSMLIAGRTGFEKGVLGLMLNLRDEGLSGLAASCPGAAVLGGFVVNSKRAEEAGRAIRDGLSSFHAEHPNEAGMNELSLYASVRRFFTGLSKAASAGLFREIIGSLIAKGVLRREGGLLALAAHRPALAGADGGIEKALRLLFSDGLKPPLPEDIAKLGFPKADTSRVLAYLQRRGDIVRIKEGTYLPGEAVKEAKEKLASHIRAKGGIKAAEFRDILGCGRKLAIEILEYFDRERVTLRNGEVRTLR